MDLANLKAMWVAEAKRYYTEALIYPTYPIWKQCNIISAGGAPKTTMDSFVSGKIADVDVIETDINALATTDALDNFDPATSDAAKITYAASYLPTLSTDEQKLSAALSLQRIHTFE